MGQGLTLSALARELGRAKSGLSVQASKGQIPRLADGTFDVAAVRAALIANIEPSRRKPAVRPPVRVNAANDEQSSPVNEQSTAAAPEPLDFNSARTADVLLKTQERQLNLALKRKELVPLAKVKDHVEGAFINYRRKMQSMPSRHAAAMAAELGCDAGLLEALMGKAVAAELNDLSAPVVRT